MRSSKVPASVQITHDRRLGLAISVDSAIALLQTTGIERQFEVNQVAAFVQVQTFGRDIGADHDQVIGQPKTLGRLAQ